MGSLILEAGKPLPSLESLRETDPARYAMFKTESDRVDAEIAVIVSQIDKQKQKDDAFRQLQEAENVRDKSPEAYERARVGYYSLTQGPEWVEQEKERIAKVDVEPVLSQYRTNHETIKSRQENQQRTQDIMNSVKEGVLTLKDDFKYTTNIFKDQIENLKSEINIERRGREKPVSESTDFYKWIDALLNLFIIAGLIYAVFVFWQKFRARSQQSAYAPMALSR